MKILHTLKIRLICICLSLVLCISLVVSNTHKVQAVVPAVIAGSAIAEGVIAAVLMGLGFVVNEHTNEMIKDENSDLNKKFKEKTGTSLVPWVQGNLKATENGELVSTGGGGGGGNGFDPSKWDKYKFFLASGAISLLANTLVDFFNSGAIKQEQNENGNIDLVYSNTMSYDEMFDFMYENINYDGALTPYHTSTDTGLVFFTDESSPSYNSIRDDRHNLKWIRLIKIDYIPTSNGEYYRDCYGYICHTNYSRYNNCIQIFFTYNDKLRSYWNYAVNFISNDYCGFNDNYNDKFGNYTYLTEPIYNTDCNSYIDDLQNKEKVAELKPDNIITNSNYYTENVEKYYVTNNNISPDEQVIPVNIPADVENLDAYTLTDPKDIFNNETTPYESVQPQEQEKPTEQVTNKTDTEDNTEPTTNDKDFEEYKTPGLSDKFPFCIPFDLIAFIEVLNADPETPHFEIPIKLDKPHIEYTMVIDLGLFDGIASLLRKLELLVFCVGLILLTRNIIKG